MLFHPEEMRPIRPTHGLIIIPMDGGEQVPRVPSASIDARLYIPCGLDQDSVLFSKGSFYILISNIFQSP